MDKSIIQGFAKLRVLTPCDFQRMDELVQDLTSALEESTVNSRGKQRKRRGRRLRSLKLSVMPSRSLTPPDTFQMPSEESISSTDEVKAPKGPGRLEHQSDSDGVSSSNCLALTNYIQRLTTFPVGHFVESDSVNENFSPVRPHRRKRKFKRMAVDPSSITSSSTLGSQSLISIPTRRPHRRKEKTGLHIGSRDLDSSCHCHESDLAVSPVFPGKRKHSMRERSVELLDGDIALMGQSSRHSASVVFASSSSNSWDQKQGLNQQTSNQCFAARNLEGRVEIREGNLYAVMDSSSSSISSSESDAGIYTNDEGREGDDEHSDFYHEGGSACGVPGVHPWWEHESLDIAEEQENETMDATFKSILSGSLQHLSQEAQLAFKASVCQLSKMPGREIRAGRRRLRDRRPGFSIVSSINEKVSKFLQDPAQNELRLYHMHKNEMHQLSHLASLYSLNMHSEGSKKNKCPVLTKTRNTTQAVSVEKCGVNNLWGWTAANDIKRRRRTPPASPEIERNVGESAEPIPDSNIGNQMLRNMGWEPGAGLGLNPDSIRSPIPTCIRPKYQGLGFNNATITKPN